MKTWGNHQGKINVGKGYEPACIHVQVSWLFICGGFLIILIENIILSVISSTASTCRSHFAKSVLLWVILITVTVGESDAHVTNTCYIYTCSIFMKYINQMFISFDWISFGEGLIVMLAHSKLCLIMLPLQSYVIVWCAIFHTLVKFKMVFCTKTTFLNSGNRHHSIHVSGQVLHWSISYEYLIHQLFRRRKSLKPRPQHEIYHTRFASCKMACFKLNFKAGVMYIEKQIKTAWYFDRLGYATFPTPKLLRWFQRISLHNEIQNWEKWNILSWIWSFEKRTKC